MQESSFGPFTLDPSTLELRKDGRRVKLKPQPARLLALLLRRRGEVVSREEIRRELWGDATFVDVDRGINSCVRQVRTALGDDAEKPRYVETIPREGYRFLSSVAPEGPTVEGRATGPRRFAAIALFLSVAAVALGLALWASRRPEAAPREGKPTLAVLAFDNLSEDPALDWLRAGLADMLITNISQSRRLSVVSTDRVFQLLGEHDALDARVTPQAVVENVARQAGADTVVLGSFLRGGERIRINVRVQDVESREIFTTASVEGEGEANLFSMVDELSRRLSAELGSPPDEDKHFPPAIAEVATPSIEAYRYFAQGWELLHDGKSSEALPMFERAVEEDPEWARALVMVSMMHNNLGHEREAEEYGLRALALAESLEPRLRYTVETWHYARREETYGRAIEVGEKLLKLEPKHNFRHIVGRRLVLLERPEDAIRHGEVFRETRLPGPLPWTSLSRAYALSGRFEEGHEVLSELLEHSPEISFAHLSMGAHLMRWGKLDEALEEIARAEALSNHPFGPDLARWEIAVIRQQWDEADRLVRSRTDLKDPTLRWAGLRRLAILALYRGRAREALSLLEEAARAYEEERGKSAQARNGKARVLLALGELDAALEEARSAKRAGRGHHPEWEGLFLEAAALARLGRTEEAMSVAATLRGRTEPIPTKKEARRQHHLLGKLAVARSEPSAALPELDLAVSMLLPRGFEFDDTLPPHLPIWYSLAEANRQAGNIERAMAWYRHIVDSSTERVWWPIEHARSLYRLGELHEREGHSEQAAEYYARFHALWKDGDLDRAQVERARGELREQRRLPVEP